MNGERAQRHRLRLSQLLRAKRKEGGVALIAVISFIGIMLAVAVLISVMSIMAGFRNELLDRMLSFNSHMYVQGQILNSPNREAALDRIRTVPGVISAAGGATVVWADMVAEKSVPLPDFMRAHLV